MITGVLHAVMTGSRCIALWGNACTSTRVGHLKALSCCACAGPGEGTVRAGAFGEARRHCARRFVGSLY